MLKKFVWMRNVFLGSEIGRWCAFTRWITDLYSCDTFSILNLCHPNFCSSLEILGNEIIFWHFPLNIFKTYLKPSAENVVVQRRPSGYRSVSRLWVQTYYPWSRHFTLSGLFFWIKPHWNDQISNWCYIRTNYLCSFIFLTCKMVSLHYCYNIA